MQTKAISNKYMLGGVSIIAAVIAIIISFTL